jgi:O-acetyl-ADP-ribose deacetylase (regulator of RNase III)
VHVRVSLGSLAQTPADAIVRSTVPRFDTGVGDALLSAAGPAVASACDELRRLVYPHGLPVGEAVSTSAGDLPARWLIHVAVPLFTVRADHEYQYTAAYRSALRVADELGVRTLALQPFGSTYPYWPLDQAIRCTFSTLSGTPTSVREVLLVLKTAASCEAYAEALARQ